MSDKTVLFYENRKLKGVFTDEKTMKKEILLHILNYHISNKFCKNLKEAASLLKKKLGELFSKDIYFMESFNNTWLIQTIDSNKIIETINIVNYNSKYAKIKIIGKELTKRDLNRNMEYLDLNYFYN